MYQVKKLQNEEKQEFREVRKAGIVDSRKEGKKVYYFISDKKLCDIFKAVGFSKAKLAKKSCCCSQ